ncbi:MAG: hypothetical protein AAGE92_17090, partial [Cyanobacteria bacterium P01_G01_bin.4]
MPSATEVSRSTAAGVVDDSSLGADLSEEESGPIVPELLGAASSSGSDSWLEMGGTPAAISSDFLLAQSVEIFLRGAGADGLGTS